MILQKWWWGHRDLYGGHCEHSQRHYVQSLFGEVPVRCHSRNVLPSRPSAFPRCRGMEIRPRCRGTQHLNPKIYNPPCIISSQSPVQVHDDTVPFRCRCNRSIAVCRCPIPWMFQYPASILSGNLHNGRRSAPCLQCPVPGS